MVTVRFLPSRRMAQVQPGTPLLRAALEAGMPLGQFVPGRWCMPRLSGPRARRRGNLSPLSDDERRADLTVDHRFACQAKVLGPVTITTSYW